MRRKFVAQVARLVRLGILRLFAQTANFLGEQIDLLLLAKDDAIQLVQQVFGVADLDFEIGNA